MSVPFGVFFFTFTLDHPSPTRLGLTLPFDPPLALVETGPDSSDQHRNEKEHLNNFKQIKI